jgi:hypothetical protein
MKPMAMLLSGLLIAGTAVAGDVYVTKDAQGNPVYTDTPQAVPAQKVDLHVSSPGPAADAADAAPAAPATLPPSPQNPASTDSTSQQATARQAAQSTAEDRAQRCVQARQRYQTLMDNWRVYEAGPDGERSYLTSEQIDAARANAKQAMDEFCADQ